MNLNSGKPMAKPDVENDPNVFVVDQGSGSSSTLLPMLIIGIILIVVGMGTIMAFS